MVTAILAAQNLQGDRRDVWAVNADEEYHEELAQETDDLLGDLRALDRSQPIVPRPLDPS